MLALPAFKTLRSGPAPSNMIFKPRWIIQHSAGRCDTSAHKNSAGELKHEFPMISSELDENLSADAGIQ
jgi:hypothetical protein